MSKERRESGVVELKNAGHSLEVDDWKLRWGWPMRSFHRLMAPDGQQGFGDV